MPPLYFVFCLIIITYLAEKDNGEKLIAKMYK